MKKMLLFLLLGITIAVIFLLYKQIAFKNSAVKDDGKMQEEEMKYTMSGYYFFGYVDEREKQDEAFEKVYFQMMGNHFQDYYDAMFIVSKEDQASDEYTKYFESIGGLRLASIPKTSVKLKNGDYITFIVQSPIKESYPAVIDKIGNIEVLRSGSLDE